MPEFPAILGAFSHQKKSKVGSGMTSASHQQVTYWFARQISEENFDVQPINVYHVPSGLRESVKSDVFLSEYTPESNYYTINTVPALASLHDKISKGEEYLNRGELDEAEKEFIKALMIDGENVQANCDLGAVYSEKMETDKLAKVIKVLMGLNGAFSFSHVDRLNAFGVRLRKNGQLDQAASFLQKSLEMNLLDDHVMFNLARVYFDQKEYVKCGNQLKMALEVNPDFSEAKKFLTHCKKFIEKVG